MATSSAIGSSPDSTRHLTLVVGLAVGQRFPPAPVDHGGGQAPSLDARRRTCRGRWSSRRSGPATGNRGDPEIDENKTNCRTGVFSEQAVQQRRGVQLRAEHGVHVVVGHVAQASLGRPRTPPDRSRQAAGGRSRNGRTALSSRLRRWHRRPTSTSFVPPDDKARAPTRPAATRDVATPRRSFRRPCRRAAGSDAVRCCRSLR